ncbi:MULTISPECIES: ABC transporter ATP-binding protein [Bacillaceae]|uniref:ABC transporter ATP-binding protein n=1 Tax=Bacillaceae TaxID=186817 RepID=UPI002963F32C|nr:ABC transporter ATP-binding protein [Bacillus infantis]MDW2876418.1 ABC transporter ATP-binding protein [Bacillus infantis]
MFSDTVIEVKDLNKVYQIYNRPIDRLKQGLIKRKQYYQKFTALENINLRINKGEAVGIIGRNGSGKSTLLQLLAGTLSPSSGKVKVNGRVAALLELGSGFNPEFTGRENIYLNGAILGLSREEMKERFKDITDFADIGDFIDRPVKTYSSGMYVRLAFAISINVNADVLIVDEALSVGDTKFQIKCIEKMNEIKNNGATILFVSHAGEQVKRFCDRAIWLKEGQLVLDGTSSEVVNYYEDTLQLEIIKSSKDPVNISKDEETDGLDDSLIAKINSVKVNNSRLNTFEELVVTIDYQIYKKKIDNFLAGVAIYSNDRKYIFGPNTYLDKTIIPSTLGNHTLEYRIPRIPLLAGTYFLDIGLFTNGGLVCIDYKNEFSQFTVDSNYFTEGLLHIEHEWRIIE